MALDTLCDSSGINTGTILCPVAPGVAKYLAVWSGKLTAAQLALGAQTCIDLLIADSKKSKKESGKLVLFPLFRDFTIQKEANTKVTLADGFSEVKREGLPVYQAKIITDLYQIRQLRKLNNKRIKYAFVDDNNVFLGTKSSNGDMLGRSGKLFTDGIDVTGYDKANGETMVEIQADNAYETFDFPIGIQLGDNIERIVSSIIDMQLYEKATAVSNVLKISAKVDYSPIGTATLDFYDDYSSSDLGTDASLWKVTNLQTGADIPVTGVAPNVAGYFDVTVQSAAYTALTSGDKISVDLVAPNLLDAAGVTGIEAVPLIHTKP